MELNLEQIKAAAMAATPGPWTVDEDCLADSDRLYVAKGQPDKLLGRILEVFHNCLVRTVIQRKANAEFIAAANPAAVLALVERLERAEAACLDLERRRAGLEQMLRQATAQLDQASSMKNGAQDDLAKLRQTLGLRLRTVRKWITGERSTITISANRMPTASPTRCLWRPHESQLEWEDKGACT